MKALLALSLVVLVSCGELPEEKKNNDIGETITRNSVSVNPGSPDYNNLKLVCQSLNFIQGRLQVLVSNRYSFSYASKSCGDENLGSASQVDVSIAYTGGEYVFSKGNGELFAFPYVAAHANGSMEDICHNLDGNLRNPMEFNSHVIAFTTAATKDCRPDLEHVCVSIKQAGSDRKVHTSEWIKFKVYNARRGFFVERGLQSSADCGDKEWIERRAKLL